jgi:hypothetical protein
VYPFGDTYATDFEPFEWFHLSIECAHSISLKLSLAKKPGTKDMTEKVAEQMIRKVGDQLTFGRAVY